MHPNININDQIVLTPFQPEDKSKLMLYLNDPVIFQNTSNIPENYSGQDAEDWLAKVAQKRQETGIESSWAIRHQTDGLIGSIGRVLKSGVGGHCDEIGYWLGAPFRGRGIMSTVVQVFSEHLFSTTTLVRLEAVAFSQNPASIRVLEKAGFEKEGYARKKFLKNGLYLDAVLLARVV